MQYLKQSTVAATIVGPILDSAGAEYASAVIGDLSYSVNGGTLTALAASATLTYIANGQYTLALNATNTGTIGRLDITCNKPTYQMPPARFEVLQATVFDALVTNAAGGLNGLPLSKASNIVDANVISVGPTGSNTAQTSGDIYGYLTTNLGALGANLTALPELVWNALTSGITTTGSVGKRVVDYLTGDAFARLGTNGAGLTAIGDTRLNNLDTAVSTRLATAGYTAPDNASASSAASSAATAATQATNAASQTTAANIRTAVGLTAANLDTQLDALPTNAELTTAITALLTTQMTEAYAADGTAPTLAQCLFLIQQSLHEFSISGTSRTVKKLDGATTAAVFTLDSATAPTSTTRTA